MARNSEFTFSITPEACVGGAVILLAVPLPWTLAWLIAAIAHEMCHCLSLALCGSPIRKITVGFNGANIQTDELNECQTVLCSLAGPVGSLLLLIFTRHFPKLALCALLQSAYNLLPVFPLDGGRALRSLLHMVFPLWLAGKICTIIEVVVLSLLLLLGCVATFVWKLGMIPIVFAVFFLLHTKKRKISCK